MTIDTNDLLNSIIESFDRMTYIQPEDIPNIDLYMDQVTTFMDDRLKASTRNKGEEKLMTKTMINNYAKNEVIPSPVKKKYSKEHILVLIMVYYFKSILQINDIKELLDPVIDKFFGKGMDFGIEEIYKEIFDDKKEELGNIRDDVISQYQEAMTKFEDAPEGDKDYLKLYSFICKLGCDVFVRKLMIEKIVDSIRIDRETREANEAKEEKKAKEKDKDREKENKYDIPVEKKSKKASKEE